MLNKTAIEKLVVLEEKYGLDAILVAPSPDLQFLRVNHFFRGIDVTTL